MLIDFDVTSDCPLQADTVIIGAGAVGLTMALQIARTGHLVTVFEAGGSAITAASQSYFTNAKSGSLDLKGLHFGRSRALGGTTNLWGGQLVEFDETIFEGRPWLGEPGWPIRKNEIAPFYHQAYGLLGLNEPLDRDAIWQRLKIAPSLPRDSFEEFFSAWLPEPNFVRLFRMEIASNPNLRIVINAPVVALEADSSGQRISGVSIRDKNNAVHTCKCQSLILANGTIEMVRLLKLPLADGRDAVWVANPWLGKGFCDHLDCRVGTITLHDKKRFHDLFDNVFLDGIKYMPKLRLASALQRDLSLNEASAYFLFDSAWNESIAHAKIFVRALLYGTEAAKFSFKIRHFVSVLPLIFPMIFRYLRQRRMFNPSDLGIQVRMTCEQRFLKSSALSVLEDVDTLGMPIVKLDWQIDGREIETMAIFAENLKRVFETSQLAEFSIDPKLMARDPRFLENIEDSNHHMGMARLGHFAEDGVVDQNLRVFGTDNLFAAGAAVFRSTGFANPTLTAIALGLRLADHLIRRKAE